MQHAWVRPTWRSCINGNRGVGGLPRCCGDAYRPSGSADGRAAKAGARIALFSDADQHDISLTRPFRWSSSTQCAPPLIAGNLRFRQERLCVELVCQRRTPGDHARAAVCEVQVRPTRGGSRLGRAHRDESMNRFDPGHVVATPGALAALEASGESLLSYQSQFAFNRVCTRQCSWHWTDLAV